MTIFNSTGKRICQLSLSELLLGLFVVGVGLGWYTNRNQQVSQGIAEPTILFHDFSHGNILTEASKHGVDVQVSILKHLNRKTAIIECGQTELQDDELRRMMASLFRFFEGTARTWGGFTVSLGGEWMLRYKYEETAGFIETRWTTTDDGELTIFIDLQEVHAEQAS